MSRPLASGHWTTTDPSITAGRPLLHSRTLGILEKPPNPLVGSEGLLGWSARWGTANSVEKCEVLSSLAYYVYLLLCALEGPRGKPRRILWEKDVRRKTHKRASSLPSRDVLGGE